MTLGVTGRAPATVGAPCQLSLGDEDFADMLAAANFPRWSPEIQRLDEPAGSQWEPGPPGYLPETAGLLAR